MQRMEVLWHLCCTKELGLPRFYSVGLLADFNQQACIIQLGQ